MGGKSRRAEGALANVESAGAHDRDGSVWRLSDGRPEVVNEKLHVMQARALRTGHDYGDVELCDVLLELKALVSGDQNVELFLRSAQKRAVLET